MDPISLSAAAVAPLAVAALVIPTGIHRVPEGHRGVYWRGGALLDRITDPGFHMKVPLVDRHEVVQVTVQTDKVTNIPCGTAGGTVIYFDRIEVVNRLKSDLVHATIKNYTVDYDKTWIYDKIHHEINQFCSQHTLEEVYITMFDTLDEALRDALQRDCSVWAPGIEIIAIRVTKPQIPAAIRANYEKVESERTRVKVMEQNQRAVEKEAETERKRAVIEAEQMREVQKITLDQQLAESYNLQKMADIENEMHLAHEKALADAAYYRTAKEAEANRQRITPEFVQLEAVRALGNNTKIFYGDKLPNVFISPDVLPGGVNQRPAALATDEAP